jgi:Ca2+-binding EF-hand superfamily protein
MTWKAWTIAAALTFSGSLYAQEEELDIPKEVEKQITKYDTDKDGKITKAEYRAVERTDSGEPEDSYEWLGAWKYSLGQFLASDTDDNLEVNKTELTTYLEYITSGKAEKYGKLSKGDVEVMDEEYFEPLVKWILAKLDADKNGKINKKEADAAGSPGVMEYDSNKDGGVDSMEMKQSEVTELSGTYDIEEGYTLKGEPSKVDTPDPNEIPEKVRENFNAMDADKNGKVSKAEWKTMLEKDNPGKPAWWGAYIAFLSLDSDDDLHATVEEFAAYGRDENEGVRHKFYPADRAEALNEIWSDLDADKDAKVVKDEWLKLFPGNEEFDGLDKDSSGDASKDEVWDLFKGGFGETFEFLDKDRETGSAEGTPNPDDPVWAHYDVKNSWTVKNTSKFMGIENVSYTKTEVVARAADHCTVRYTMLDKDKQPIAGVAPTEVKIEFRKSAGTPAADAPKVTELGTETIKVEAGEIECTVTQVEMEIAGAKHTTKTWMHKKYPGLMVKSESTSDQSSVISELVEFID